MPDSKGHASTQKVFPTNGFRDIGSRVGYASSTQMHILMGDGTFNGKKNILTEDLKCCS